MEEDNHDTDKGDPLEVDESGSSDQDVVRIVLISDTHGLHDKLHLPPDGGDVLIHCGDFANRGSIADVHSFRDWMQYQTQFKERVVIAGNHDRDLNRPDAIDLRAEFSKAKSDSSAPIIFLEDESVRCAEGRLHIYGVSWNTCEQEGYESLDLVEKEKNGPIDILLSHIPPFWKSRHSRVDKGSLALAKVAFKQSVPICCGGHLHWARGAVRYVGENDGTSSSNWFINASSKQPSQRNNPHPLDDEAVFPPIVIDYNIHDRQIVGIEGLDPNFGILKKRMPPPFKNTGWCTG